MKLNNPSQERCIPRAQSLALLVLTCGALVACSKSDLDCSSAPAQQTLSGIVTKFVYGDTPDELKSAISINTTFDAIRTVSGTDKAKLCHATASVQVAYTGPQEGPPDEAKDKADVDATIDSAMAAASVPDATQALIRNTAFYKDPGHWRDNKPGTVMRTRGRVEVIDDAFGEAGFIGQGWGWDVQKTDAFEKMRAEDRAESARRNTILQGQQRARFLGRRAEQSSGDIEYTVSKTDDGGLYVSIGDQTK